jgi:hypothetical protein
VEIRTVAKQFLFEEYLLQIFGVGSLQCRTDPGKEGKDSQVKTPGKTQVRTPRQIQVRN